MPPTTLTTGEATLDRPLVHSPVAARRGQVPDSERCVCRNLRPALIESPEMDLSHRTIIQNPRGAPRARFCFLFTNELNLVFRVLGLQTLITEY